MQRATPGNSTSQSTQQGNTFDSSATTEQSTSNRVVIEPVAVVNQLHGTVITSTSSATQSLAQQAAPLLALPRDVITLIILAMNDLYATSKLLSVCRFFWQLSKEASLYQKLYLKQGLTMNTTRAWQAYIGAKWQTQFTNEFLNCQNLFKMQRELLEPIALAQQKKTKITKADYSLNDHSPFFIALYFKLELLALRLFRELPSAQRESEVLGRSVRFKTTALHLAASLGNEALFTEMFSCIPAEKQTAAITAVDENNNSVLFNACHECAVNPIAWLLLKSLLDDDIAKLAVLVSTKTRFNLLGEIALRTPVPVSEENLQLFTRLFTAIPAETRASVAVDLKGNSGMLLLTQAVSNQRNNLVDAMVALLPTENCADVILTPMFGNNALEFAVANGDLYCFDKLLACVDIKKQKGVIQALFKKEPSIIHRAILSGSILLLERLLTFCLDEEQRQVILWQRNSAGESALHQLANRFELAPNQDKEVVQQRRHTMASYLLKTLPDDAARREKLTKRDKQKRTPLHIAARTGHKALFELFLDPFDSDQRKALFNESDRNDLLLLHHAFASQNRELFLDCFSATDADIANAALTKSYSTVRHMQFFILPTLVDCKEFALASQLLARIPAPAQADAVLLEADLEYSSYECGSAIYLALRHGSLTLFQECLAVIPAEQQRDEIWRCKVALPYPLDDKEIATSSLLHYTLASPDIAVFDAVEALLPDDYRSRFFLAEDKNHNTILSSACNDTFFKGLTTEQEERFFHILEKTPKELQAHLLERTSHSTSLSSCNTILHYAAMAGAKIFCARIASLLQPAEMSRLLLLKNGQEHHTFHCALANRQYDWIKEFLLCLEEKDREQVEFDLIYHAAVIRQNAVVAHMLSALLSAQQLKFLVGNHVGGMNPFHRLALIGNHQALLVLLTLIPDVHREITLLCQDQFGNNILHFAAATIDITHPSAHEAKEKDFFEIKTSDFFALVVSALPREIVRALLCQKNREDYTPLGVAVLEKNILATLECIRILKRAKLLNELVAPMKNGMTIFHLMIERCVSGLRPKICPTSLLCSPSLTKEILDALPKELIVPAILHQDKDGVNALRLAAHHNMRRYTGLPDDHHLNLLVDCIPPQQQKEVLEDKVCKIRTIAEIAHAQTGWRLEERTPAPRLPVAESMRRGLTPRVGASAEKPKTEQGCRLM